MGNSFSLQHSPRFLRTPSTGSLVPVVIQLGKEKKKKWNSDNKREQARDGRKSQHRFLPLL